MPEPENKILKFTLALSLLSFVIFLIAAVIVDSQSFGLYSVAFMFITFGGHNCLSWYFKEDIGVTAWLTIKADSHWFVRLFGLFSSLFFLLLGLLLFIGIYRQ
ncbi:hypothetical protein [Thalassomonas sp. RHCl1]|uniref:hypothetical protein n=1 Tax=Thalassomonas sp. RHCl1 TaxID=2995320 RepID=UPI00248C9DB1|nr:hypothetical protein [Thalassomonas sp. RHCl1]